MLNLPSPIKAVVGKAKSRAGLMGHPRLLCNICVDYDGVKMFVIFYSGSTECVGSTKRRVPEEVMSQQNVFCI